MRNRVQAIRIPETSMRTIAAAILALAVLAPPVQAASSACGGSPVPEEQALADAELANLDAQEVAKRHDELHDARRKALLERLICSDQELSGLNSDMNNAYWAALKRAGRYNTVALRADQRDFEEGSIQGLDYRLNGVLADSEPKGEYDHGENRAHGRKAAIKDLRARMTDRIKVLKAFEPDRESFEGEWRSQSGRLEIAKDGKGYKVSAFMNTFGWTRHWCRLEGAARREDGGLIADAQGVNGKPKQLRLRLKGAGLTSEALESGEGYFCPRGGDLDKTAYFIPVRRGEADAEKDTDKENDKKADNGREKNRHKARNKKEGGGGLLGLLPLPGRSR
jgi:hypothetical protein